MHRFHFPQLRFWLVLLSIGAVALTHGSAASDRTIATAETVDQEPRASGGLDLELVGQIGGPSLALEQAGDLLLAGVGPRVYAWDATTEGGPTLLGVSEILPGIVRDIKVVGDTAYVAAGHLVTMDLTEPETLPLGKHRFAPLEGRKVSAIGYNGDRIYIATLMNESSGGGSIVTLSNTQETGLQVVHSEKIGGVMRRMEVSDDYAFIVGLEAVGVMDLSDPDVPKEVRSSLHGVNLDVADGYLVTIERDTVGLWDASNPLASDPIDWKRIPGLQAERIDILESTVLVAGESGRLVRIPLTDDRKLGEPQIVHDGDPDLSVYPTGIVSVNASTFVSSAQVSPGARWSSMELMVPGARVQAFKNSNEDPRDVVRGSSLWPSGFAIEGGTLYSAEGGGVIEEYLEPSVWAHLVSDMKATSSRVISQDPSGEQPALLADAGRLVVAGQPGFVELYDVSDANNPVRAARLNERWGDHAVALAVEGDTLYAAQNMIRRMDIRDLTAPTLLEPTHRVGEAQDLIVRSNNAYVASLHGFMIIDLAAAPEPGLPKRYLSDLRDAIGVELRGDLAFVSTVDERVGLTIVDVSNPDSMEIIGQLPGLVGDVALVGDHAIVASIDKLSIVDISDPRNMSVVREIGIPGFAADGWGYPLGELPELERLDPDGVEIYPRIIVLDDTLYYTFPMAGILAFRIKEGEAPPTPDPSSGSEVYLPKLMLQHEPEWERSGLVLAPRSFGWDDTPPIPDLISLQVDLHEQLFAGFWDRENESGELRAWSRVTRLPGGTIEGLTSAPMVMEVDGNLLRAGLSRNVGEGDTGELNLYRFEGALERVVGLASVSLDGRPWRLTTKGQVSYVVVNRSLPYGPFPTRLAHGFETSTPGSLQMVSVLPDGSANRLGRVDFDAAVADMTLMEGRAFILSPEAGLFEIDIQDPRQPAVMSRLPFNQALTMALNPHRKLLFVVGPTMVTAVDLTIPGDMRPVNDISTPLVLDCPCLRSFNLGGALVVSGQTHLGLFDVRDPVRMAFDSWLNFSTMGLGGPRGEPWITDMLYAGPEILVGGTYSTLGEVRIVAR